MSDNAYLRKDGRLEARIIIGKSDNGKRVYRSTAANYRMKAEKHIIPEFGGKICSEVRLKDIYDFMERKTTEGLSARYISDIIVLMKSVFKYAVRTYHIPNVFDGIVMPKRTKADVKILSANEQARTLTLKTVL